ncbi:hypothetical protein MRB53_004643 [Persea americana]|uniref:Uncharacterized protein n=1 Tax=Persea americana TaxID=3435 RepID=A0ACC2MB49_PERAE|nr:hypothetical protein MRB53_004643 [Persea americana]
MSSKANQVLDEVREAEKLHPSNSTQKIRHPNSLLPSFTFRHLNALAVMVVLSASGMVSIEDIAFVFFSFFYTIFLFKFAFPDLTPSLKPPVFGSKINRLMFYYVPLTAFVGLFFPIAYILEGFFRGEKERIEAAAPHVFLLASQLFMEGVTFSNRFSLPIRAFVPICYNARRMFAIVDWSRSEFGKVGEEFGGGGWRLQVGKGLAIANLVLWSYNLFGFLLPVWLPIVFKGYYGFKLKD